MLLSTSSASLMVACLKRLLPVGLNLFAGREQELVQHCKDRYLKVFFFIYKKLLFDVIFNIYRKCQSMMWLNLRELS